MKFRRIDDGYKECLNAFLDHMFATSVDNNKISCPHSICANHFYDEREIIRDHLIIKGMNAGYQKFIWTFHRKPTISDDDADDDIVDDAFNDENYGLFDHDMHDMRGDAFDCHESNEGSSRLNEEAQIFFKLIEDTSQPLYRGCEEFSKLAFFIEMYRLKCLYAVTDRAFDAFVKLFNGALTEDSTLPDFLRKYKVSLSNLVLATKRSLLVRMTAFFFRKIRLN